jgi:hypothetical protein
MYVSITNLLYMMCDVLFSWCKTDFHRQWHVNHHTEKIVLKFVTGHSPNATAWDKKFFNCYGRLANVYGQTNYDIKQGTLLATAVLGKSLLVFLLLKVWFEFRVPKICSPTRFSIFYVLFRYVSPILDLSRIWRHRIYNRIQCSFVSCQRKLKN